MFDTIALADAVIEQPDVEHVAAMGGHVRYNRYSGRVAGYVVNGPKDSKEPRITVNYDHRVDAWRVRAEASVPTWLNGSSLLLPTEEQIDEYLYKIGDFITIKTGLSFDPWNARVTRLDVTRDIAVDDSHLFTVLARLRHVRLPKYHTHPIDDTTVEFRTKGEKSHKTIIAYSKKHQLRHEGCLKDLQMIDQSLLRIEVKHLTNKAVTNLANQLRLRDHKAKNIITALTHNTVIERATTGLGLNSLIEAHFEDPVERLLRSCDTPAAQRLIGHLYCTRRWGQAYYDLPFITLTKRTVKGYAQTCKRVGIMSLE